MYTPVPYHKYRLSDPATHLDEIAKINENKHDSGVDSAESTEVKCQELWGGT